MVIDDILELMILFAEHIMFFVFYITIYSIFSRNKYCQIVRLDMVLNLFFIEVILSIIFLILCGIFKM